MELKKELDKLQFYFGSDVNEFKNQYKKIQENFISEKDIERISEFMENMVSSSSEETDRQMDEIQLRYKLIMNKDIIPFSYIAKNYFQKSRGWLQQKINGNMKNGKPAHFSSEELDMLNFALQDISKKLGSITV